MPYYGASAVEEHGRYVPHNYQQPRVMPGFKLVAILDNGLHRIAADVTDPEDWREHYGVYSRGSWLTMTVYELTNEQAAACPDTGHEPSRQ